MWSRKRLQRLCHCSTSSPTFVVLVDLRVTEAGRKRWWSRVQGYVPGSVQGWLGGGGENGGERLSTELRGCVLKVRMRWQDSLTGDHGLWWMSFSGSTRFPSEEAVDLPQLAKCKDLEPASISICVHRRPPLSLPRSKPPRLKPPRAPPFFKRLSVSRSISASSLTFFGNRPPSPTASFPPLHLPFTLLASIWIAEREGYNSWHADHRYWILYQKGRFLIKNRGQRRIEAFDTETSDSQ